MSCFLCGNSENVIYNVDSTVTKRSGTILLKLIENIVSCLQKSSSNVCCDCNSLINELDYLQIRAAEIEIKFKSYINDTETGGEIKDEINLPEENIIAPIAKQIKKKSQRHKCDECGKEFRTTSELKGHIVAHSDERPFVCEICGKAYKAKKAFKIHMGMHNGVNPFTCEYCKKSFTQKISLLRHLPLHTGEMPYQCDLCGKRFVHRSSLNIHQISHTGLKSYKCGQCGLALMSNSHLTRHMKTHTGEKKYSCTTCARKFTEKYNLVAHEKLHADGEAVMKLSCQFCGAAYSRKKLLESHLRNHH